MTSIEKQLLKQMLTKHQQKNPGCKLSEKRCTFETSKNCIGKGPITQFHGRMCQECRTLYNRRRHAKQVGTDPDKPRSVGRPRKSQ